jgi:hypothetical protein
LGRDSGAELESCYSLAGCIGLDWKIPAPETWEAISNAATTAGTLINLRNWCRRSPARETTSVFGRRYAEVAQECAPHALVVAEAGALGNLDDTADLPAFEQ